MLHRNKQKAQRVNICQDSGINLQIKYIHIRKSIATFDSHHHKSSYLQLQ